MRVKWNFRLFTFIQRTSELSNSSSIQGPRFGIGMMLAVGLLPSAVPEVKYTPGERWIWETITRSAPLMMNVPSSVIRSEERRVGEESSGRGERGERS